MLNHSYKKVSLNYNRNRRKSFFEKYVNQEGKKSELNFFTQNKGKF